MLVSPSGSRRDGSSGWLFCSKLETTDGVPAEPPTLSSAVPNWRRGDTIPLGGKTLRVVEIRETTKRKRLPF
jgi:hypothetical protein